MVLPSRKSAASKKCFCITCCRNQSDSFNMVVAPSVAMRMVCSDLDGDVEEKQLWATENGGGGNSH